MTGLLKQPASSGAVEDTALSDVQPKGLSAIVSGRIKGPFDLTFPIEVAELVTEIYGDSRVILEYGLGGSTVLAAGLPGKFVMGVENDRSWAMRLNTYLEQEEFSSPVAIHHVDIGPVGDWGRPFDDRHWPRYHLYPLSVWDQAWFRAPDTVLIDGRFRVACLIAVMMRTMQPVRVLFDDYLGRPQYQLIEEILRPVRMVERMAIFDISPGMLAGHHLTRAIAFFGQASFAPGPGRKAGEQVQRTYWG